ncbi:MAG: glucose-1-phosphate adenylyltransferase [Acidobacteria bacterium]|nr:glucose-1-phosphate adenylyltransferase [Acidobacteriota bacterium]
MPLRETYLTPRHTISVILAGGRGKRLMDLTDHLAKPGLDFAGKYKIIDFTLSNCINSGFRRIAVLTQYNSHRLLEHLQFGWTFLPGRLNEYIHVWPAQQSLDKDAWYSGTADAIYQNLSNIQAFEPENVMILAGDHVYKMDYKYFLEDHLNANADMTIACLEVPRLSATGFGVAGVDEQDRITSWVEKSPNPPGIPGNPEVALASMGIYLFKANFLREVLEQDAQDRDSGHDFGTDLIPSLVPRARVFAHRFDRSCVQNPLRPGPYWRDVGTLDAYWEANIDLTHAVPALNLYDQAWPIYSYIEPLPPAKFVHSDPHRQGVGINSLISAGCIVSGANVRQSVLFTNARVHSHARLEETLVLPGADIGEHARLRRCVVAPDVRIPEGLVAGEDAEADGDRFYRTPSGVTLISQRMLDRL